MAKTGVAYFIQQVKKNGLQHVVISPGSRNAPLTVAFTEDDSFTCYSIADERSAAFFAMGIAQQKNKPVAVLCTSGSALLNYAPAVSEAFYQEIPLVVISADRPSMWTDQGDGQTVRQNGALANHVHFETELNENASSDDEVWELNRKIDQGFQTATVLKKGPIHFNFPFTEPLYDKKEIQLNPTKHIALFDLEKNFNANQLEILCNEWNTSSKRMIIVGQNALSLPLQQALIDLAEDQSVAVLVENTSNCTHRTFTQCIDRSLNSISKEKEVDFAPDILITIGGAIVSKRIKKFIRRNKPKHHWRVGKQFPFMDTYQSLTRSFEMDAINFFEQLNFPNLETNISNYGGKWKQLDLIIQEKHTQFFQDPVYSDLSVFEMVLDFIPENSQLHMANSSVIRYCQLFDNVASINRYCNRGTSGIDGSTSTAVGAATAKPNELITFITGDISFYYDSNALWNNYLKENLKIILINNSGGGIFKIIEGPATTNALDKYFTTKQERNAEDLCKAFDVNYLKANSLVEIENQMETFYSKPENNRPMLLEIFTPYDLNDQELQRYFEHTRVSY